MSLRWRLGAVVALVLLLGWQGIGGFFDKDLREAAWWLPDEGVRLGLDLRGGIHMVLSPDLEVALDRELSSLKDGLERDIEDASITGVKLFVTDREMHIQPSGPADAAKIQELLAEWNVVEIARPDETEFVLTLTSETTDRVRNEAMGQALEVLRRRIDDPQTGIPESVITKQGKDRILIQIPGMDRVPDILGTTGFLEFKIVQDAAPTEDLLRAKYESGLPDGMVIAFERDRESDRILNAYLIPGNADITGERLTDARVGFDNRRNEWLVSFTWDAEGGRIFGELTEANLQKPLAIILDGGVFSAPTIQSRISRNGQITGRFTSQEATDLAIILRAGALPIPLRIEEERTIGPGDPGVHARLLPALRRLREHRTVRESGDDRWFDVDLPRHAHRAGYRGPGAHGRDGRRCQRDHLRADSRRSEGWPHAPCRDWRGLPESALDDPGCEHHHPRYGDHPLQLWHRPDQGLRRDPLRRDSHQRVRSARTHSAALRGPSRPEERVRAFDLGVRCARRDHQARHPY